ncbi:MAG: ComEC/Rec2 family competence protein [Eubacteriales bacterium]|nr:ComEC/Rec2 family competence protein [Eubacteriales bacterium]
MARRPICLVCLLLTALMCLADALGFPLIRGNPLPKPVQELIREQPQARLWGEAEQYIKTEFSASLVLKDAILIHRSKKYPIKNVKVYLNKDEGRISPGTRLLVRGRLERVPERRNPGEFDSRQYYACQHVYYYLKKGEVEKSSPAPSGYRGSLLRVKERLVHVLKEVAGEEASVFTAIVLGEKSGLEEEVRLQYQMGGIIHILAISGLHISLWGMGLYRLLKRLGLGIWPAGLLAFGVMLQYGMMTGGSVSTMRAVCMFLLYTGAKIAGRTYDRPTALALSALVILSESPACLYTSGFLLSFGCVLGLLCFLPAVESLLGVVSPLGKSGASSLAVFFFTLPITLYFYGEVSLAGIFLNLLVLPTVGLVLVSGVLAALLGSVFAGAGALAALPGRALLYGYRTLCLIAGKIPYSTWTGGQPRLWQIALYYGLLVLLMGIAHGRKRTAGKRLSSGASFRKAAPGKVIFGRAPCGKGGLLLALVLGAGLLVLSPIEDPCLRITCLDVGQGDGIVVESPEGYGYLVDGGSSDKKGTGQRQILPYLKSRGISYLDGIFISHTDGDHVSGVRELLGLVERRLTALRIGCLYLPKLSSPPEEWKELRHMAERAGVLVRQVKEGDRLAAGRLQVSFLCPEEGAEGRRINEEGMVFRLEYGAFSGLFTGDIGQEAEQRLLERGLLEPAVFLKTAHHGSAYSTSGGFLDMVRPQEAVISCSRTNTYGHPSPETVGRLQAAGCHVDYTMHSGAVTIKTDGKGWRVERFIRE